jgi:hypothetical protein
MMESVVNLIFSAENIRMLVLLVFGFCGYVLMKSQMRGLEYSLSKRIDGVDHKIDCVENTIEALTFTLEKNGFLKREDKEYIDGRLDK